MDMPIVDQNFSYWDCSIGSEISRWDARSNKDEIETGTELGTGLNASCHKNNHGFLMFVTKEDIHGLNKPAKNIEKSSTENIYFAGIGYSFKYNLNKEYDVNLFSSLGLASSFALGDFDVGAFTDVALGISYFRIGYRVLTPMDLDNYRLNYSAPYVSINIPFQLPLW